MKLIYITFLLATTTACAQLHHQMLSSQGATSKSSNGIIVTQTIGQQSVIGNYKNQRVKLNQGFQQANWNRIIMQQTNPEFEVSIYPNPFEGTINIQHNTQGDMNINIFDPSGRLVYKNLINSLGSNQSLNLERLPSGIYLIHLQSNHLKYFTKLIKK